MLLGLCCSRSLRAAPNAGQRLVVTPALGAQARQTVGVKSSTWVAVLARLETRPAPAACRGLVSSGKKTEAGNNSLSQAPLSRSSTKSEFDAQASKTKRRAGRKRGRASRAQALASSKHDQPSIPSSQTQANASMRDAGNSTISTDRTASFANMKRGAEATGSGKTTSKASRKQVAAPPSHALGRNPLESDVRTDSHSELKPSRKEKAVRMEEDSKASESCKNPAGSQAFSPYRLIVMVGLPGSGKSTFATSFASRFRCMYVSQDQLGSRKECETLVEKTAATDPATSILVDRCNVRLEERRNWITRSRADPEQIAIVYFAPPPAEDGPVLAKRLLNRVDHPTISTKSQREAQKIIDQFMKMLKVPDAEKEGVGRVFRIDKLSEVPQVLDALAPPRS